MCSKRPRRSRLWHPGDRQTPAAKAVPGSTHPWPEPAPALRLAACRQGCHSPCQVAAGPARAPRSVGMGTRGTGPSNPHVFPKPPHCQGCLLRAASTRTSTAASHVRTPRSGLSHVQTESPAFGADSQLITKGRKKKPCLGPHAPLVVAQERGTTALYRGCPCPTCHAPQWD